MSARHHSSRWYGTMIQNESQDVPRSATSRVGSVLSGLRSMNRDPASSLCSSRGSSSSSDAYDLSASIRFKFKPKVNEDIVDILQRNPPSRPRSVALGKYNPLPAIISDGRESRAEILSDTASSEEEFHLRPDEESEEYPADDDSVVFVPPPLVRSGTFDVIETHLERLPVVDSSESDEERDDFEPIETDPLSRLMTDDCDTVKCQLTIDGITLSEYLAQERHNTIQKTMLVSDLHDNYSRPCSTSSLITHHGSPDSGFSPPYRALAGLFEGRLTSSRSSRSVKYELKDDQQIDSHEGHYIKFPDNNLVFVRWVNEQTLLDMITMIQTLEFENQIIRIDITNLAAEDLVESVTHWGISQDSVIHLIHFEG